MNQSSSHFPVLSSQLPLTAEDAETAEKFKAKTLRAPRSRRALRLSWSFVRWLKFNFVGGIGIGVQLGVLVFLRSVLHLDTLLATGLAVETAVIHNFLWHERFTWPDRPAARLRDSLLRLAKFNASNGAVSLVGNLVIMRALAGELHLNYVVANLIAVAVCSLVNFLLSDRLVFQNEAGMPARNEWTKLRRL
jgi:putative flippase GtrA